MTFITMKVVGAVVGNRVPLEDEINGLDIPEMGAPGYASESGHPAGTPEGSSASVAAAPAPALVSEPAL